MKETVFTEGGHRFLYRQNELENVPLVILAAHRESTEQLMEACARPLDILVCLDLDWDADLSPWPSKPVISKEDDFKGYGFELAKDFEKALSHVPETRKSCIIVAGYSMGGLFALYAPYFINNLYGIAAASPSVWYPDFYEYIDTNPYPYSITRISLSLGDRESCHSNPYLKTTETVLRKLDQLYVSRNISCSFRLDPGDHFTQPDKRLAACIATVLK